MSAPKESSTASRYGLCPSVVNGTRCRNRPAKSLINSVAHRPSRVPTNQQGTSFVSASIAIHVQTLPIPNWSRLSSGTFLSFTATNDHISSHWMRRSEEHTSELQSRQYLVCR